MAENRLLLDVVLRLSPPKTHNLV
ncbi:uncharacterized protein G2W53_040519 [Senna tora]|uniref:Uncharacterized protein n=1 Tax=Senna tora TaxID=362788 RepID=A0A834VXA6_9FABA|nr:uncharacterized protein G2W53_040519 [Senna tora]